ncbi:MAG: TolC family protein [Planctomycetes bacterium]|nr:TolC family protein [Planctomycetota bacterium]
MLKKNATFSCLFVTVAALGGCATVDPRHDYGRVARHVTEATGRERVYRPEDDALVASIVDELSREGMTATEAVEICLLNNPTLQSQFMNVGMARADAVQAGLFSNPFVGISARFPDGGGLANIEAGVAQNIAELWQIPLRKRAAERSLDAAILDLARTAAEIAADAKAAYYVAIGSDERFRIARENLDIAKNLLDLALTRQKAGAANELDVNLSRGIALNAEIEVERARLAAADARRELATILGLSGDADALALTDPLPTEFPETPEAESLVQIAKVWRLDIQTAQQAVAAAQARLEYEYRLVWPVFELGLEMERSQRMRQGGRDVLADTVRSSIAGGGMTAPGIQPRSERRSGKGQDVIFGPSLGIELPIFDQNQAQIAKAQYALQQARKTLDALDRAVTQEVRSAVDRAMTAWRLMQMYRDRSIPLAQGNLDLSREAYRAGRASFLSVLEAQRFFLEARRGYVEASQSAATMIPQLERTIGLPFDRFLEEVENPTRPSHTPDEEHGS